MEPGVELDLAEVAQRVGTSVEKLVRLGARGELTISVVADNWPVQTDSEKSEVLSGLVHLAVLDLVQSYNADFTLVRQVTRIDKKQAVDLIEPVKVLRGVMLVTPEEFRRFQDECVEIDSGSEIPPPYLDPTHEWYSSELASAVCAWLALFSGGSFDPKGKSVKQQIERWLSSHGDKLSSNARKNTATLVNPDTTKKGGAPRTPGK